VATGDATAYKVITFGMSPYTVLASDDFLSVNATGGPVILNFPNAPTPLTTWYVKDMQGVSPTNNISLTTPGGTVTFDNMTTYVIDDPYESTRILANPAGNYELY